SARAAPSGVATGVDARAGGGQGSVRPRLPAAPTAPAAPSAPRRISRRENRLSSLKCAPSWGAMMPRGVRARNPPAARRRASHLCRGRAAAPRTRPRASRPGAAPRCPRPPRRDPVEAGGGPPTSTRAAALRLVVALLVHHLERLHVELEVHRMPVRVAGVDLEAPVVHLDVVDVGVAPGLER